MSGSPKAVKSGFPLERPMIQGGRMGSKRERTLVNTDKEKRIKRYIVGNWKCSKTFVEAVRWFDDFARKYRPADNLQVIISPPMIWLKSLADQLKSLGLSGVTLAAQDVSGFPPGSYTGAIAADMLTGIADYALVGHSERRRYFHETSLDVTNKVSEAIDAGIKPIVCVEKSYAMSQLTSLGDMETEQMIIAYSPVDAMSYREPEAVEKVEEAARFISGIHPYRPIIYGGAIGPDNAHRYASIPGIAGLIAGAASLDAESFNEICLALAG